MCVFSLSLSCASYSISNSLMRLSSLSVSWVCALTWNTSWLFQHIYCVTGYSTREQLHCSALYPTLVLIGYCKGTFSSYACLVKALHFEALRNFRFFDAIKRVQKIHLKTSRSGSTLSSQFPGNSHDCHCMCCCPDC